MLHQVGVGALGPVFRTYEPTRDRLVAVKVFRLDITPEQAQSLADELAHAADAGLFHPSIVEPIASGVEGTVAYRAEEYVAAESLDVAMRHYAPAPIDTVLPFITQLAGAIDFARTAGVGHGALHPRDIFVTPDEARASGFGVVEALERAGLRAPVRRPYSAPERVTGGSWGTPADVFSLAAIAYELLTGRRPAGTGAQIGSLTETGVGPHGAAVHAVLAQGMDDDPAQRFPSALEFASSLDAAARGEQPAAATGAKALVAPLATADEPDPDADVWLMPPPDVIDERAEPVRAEQAPAAEPVAALSDDPDDIVIEREPDEAFGVMALEDEDIEAGPSASDRTLFEEESAEDLSLSEPPAATGRFADEFALAADDFARRPLDTPRSSAVSDEQEEERFEHPAARRYAPVPRTPDEPAVRERSVGFFVVAALIGIALFAAGYMMGGRNQGAQPDAAVGISEPSPAPAPGDAPQPYSEQAVAPPEPVPTAPPVPVDEPARTSAATVPVPEPAAPAAGRLIVQSAPAGAGVTVDGRWRGRTPLTLSDLKFGTYQVRVVQPGFSVASEAVALSTSAPSRTLSFRLQRTPAAPAAAAPGKTPPKPAPQTRQAPQTFTGSIFVDSRPQGARVLLNGKAVGTTPVRLPDVRVGSHVVRLQLEDHRDWSTTARVVSGQEARVTGSLERNR